MNNPYPFVFFGSGPVAAKNLELLKNDFDVEAIITKPATVAEMHRVCPTVPVYEVSKRQELDALIASANLKSSYAILVDFGIIVSAQVIQSFRLGIINSHFSILPQWRGADPITFAILSGQDTTGVSLMLLVEAMDEGPILAQSPYRIPSDATTPSLTDALVDLSSSLLHTVVPAYLNGQILPQPQETESILQDKTPSYSRRLRKDDGVIDWTKPAYQLEREVRAYIGWPKSRTELAGKEVIITEARTSTRSGRPGVVSTENKQLIVCCGEGSLEILRLKPAGKPSMTSAAFLAGYGRRLA